MAKVLISDKLSPRAKEIFENNGIEVDVKVGMTPEELKACIGEYDGLAIRSATRVTEDILESADNLKVIGRAGIGTDNIDKASASAKGVVVMNTPFGNSITTAEHAVAMMFAAARKIPQANESTHKSLWEKSKFMGTELYNKTLGIIGAGNIGSIVADRAKGLHMKVIAFDPFLTEERAADMGVEKVELDELFPRADFITLHTPLNDHTRGILGAENIAKCKKGVIIVNCARGGLIDETALKAAIESGHVASAALDVFEEEPAKENQLFGMEQVICTPHLGASTSEAQENVALQVADQISDYLNNGTINNALNVPSVSADDAKKLNPYIELANMLGGLAGQLNDTAINSIEIIYEGGATALNTKPVTNAILKGVLSAQSEGVNMVNAPTIAKDRNVQVKDTNLDGACDYQNQVTVKLDGKFSVSGTVFDGSHPRVVNLDDKKVESSLGKNVLYVHNQDKPGLIGSVGSILGESGINIANFNLGRTGENNALAIVVVDSEINAEIISKIDALPSVIKTKALKFDL